MCLPEVLCEIFCFTMGQNTLFDDLLVELSSIYLVVVSYGYLVVIDVIHVLFLCCMDTFVNFPGKKLIAALPPCVTTIMPCAPTR